MNKLLTTFFAAAILLFAPIAFAAARVAVVHAAPFSSDLEATAVNIVINGTVVYEGVKFGGFADYTELVEVYTGKRLTLPIPCTSDS